LGVAPSIDFNKLSTKIILYSY